MEEKVTISLKIEPELCKVLDEMVQKDDSDRSKLIRQLIRREASRRAVETVRKSEPRKS